MGAGATDGTGAASNGCVTMGVGANDGTAVASNGCGAGANDGTAVASNGGVAERTDVTGVAVTFCVVAVVTFTGGMVGALTCGRGVVDAFSARATGSKSGVDHVGSVAAGVDVGTVVTMSLCLPNRKANPTPRPTTSKTTNTMITGRSGMVI